MARSVLAFLAVSAVTSAAFAQGKSDADTLFHDARALVLSGDFAHACPKFAESEKLDPAPGTLLNLAECEEHLGHLIEAQEHYRLAASGFPKKDQRREICATKSAALDGRIAHVTLRLAPDVPEGTVVKKDDVSVAAADLGQPIATNPGDLSVVVTAPGHESKSYPLTVKEGDATDLTLQVGPVGAEPQTQGPKTVVVEKPQETASSPLRPIGITVAVVGVVGLGVGIVTGIMAIDRANTVKTHCNTMTNICADQEGLSASQDGQVLAPLSTVTIIAGGVLAALGAVLYAVGGHSAKARVAVGLGSVSVEGTF
jgi:hypothetical protein